MLVNKNFFNVSESYLFSTIAKKVNEFAAKHPDKKIIRMGIGDVTRPLCPAVVGALKRAALEMGDAATFRGYGPEQGYDFLRTAIKDYYLRRGVELELEEIFISDGAKSDIANILDLFAAENTVLIPNPVYPVYLDTNIMGGRKILFMDANEQNLFLPLPDRSVKADIIYICSPNNPTGAVYDTEGLKKWVDYARGNGAIILFDAAYEAYIKDDGLPRSIFEIEGAEECAIEFCSLSKTAGFTGTRCGYTVVPKALSKLGADINKMWLRRQTTKFNGVAYIVQRGAEAVFTPDGQRQIRESIGYYMENAGIISSALSEAGVWHVGGKNSPYIWLKCPDGMSSWNFFDYLLEKANVVGTPGSGFGKNGEGYFRMTAFASRENTIEAMERIKKIF
ncbi:MAG: LL-diaminopimelate aminotransferase [Clostridiales bacterium]|nr:LL-diaminopimelate aminotransferase [Clostridiales bacterium]